MDSDSGLTPGVLGTPGKIKNFAEFPDVWATASALTSGSVLATPEGLVKLPPTTTERNLIVLGGKSAGKTTLISRYLEKKAEIRDTVGIAYSFFKRQRDDDSHQTDIANIWEIASSPFVAEMLEIVTTQQDPKKFMIFVVIDISKTESIFGILENILSSLNGIRNLLSEAPVWIVGNKFDQQQSLNLELDKRQAIADVLYQLASTFSFGLIYTSKQNNVDGRIKNVLDGWFSGEKMSDYPTVTDALKLVYLAPLLNAARRNLTAEDIQRFRNVISSSVPQKAASEFRSTKDATEGMFSESEIDDSFALISAELKAKNSLLRKEQKSRLILRS